MKGKLEIEIEEGANFCSGKVLQGLEDFAHWLDEEGDVKISKKNMEKVRFPITVLDAIDVIEENRGRGVGKRLLEKFLDVSQGTNGVMLIADIYEDQAVGFDVVKWYEKYDFKRIGKASNMPLMLRENQ